MFNIFKKAVLGVIKYTATIYAIGYFNNSVARIIEAITELLKYIN